MDDGRGLAYSDDPYDLTVHYWNITAAASLFFAGITVVAPTLAGAELRRKQRVWQRAIVEEYQRDLRGWTYSDADPVRKRTDGQHNAPCAEMVERLTAHPGARPALRQFADGNAGYSDLDYALGAVALLGTSRRYAGLVDAHLPLVATQAELLDPSVDLDSRYLVQLAGYAARVHARFT